MTETEAPDCIWVQFADNADGLPRPLNIRKWDTKPFEGADAYALSRPSPAVEEKDRALERALACLVGSYEQPQDAEAVISAIRAALAAAPGRAAEDMRERAAKAAEAIDSGRGNEAEIAKAIRSLPAEEK